MRQYNRDTPYSVEHRGSLARKGRQPHDLQGYLAWLLEEYRPQVPDKLHSSDVWRDRVSAGEEEVGIKAVGGSLLGSPRTNDAFRRYIEDSPFSTEVAEYEGHKDVNGSYAGPLRAALARLAGRGPASSLYPFMARALHQTAVLDGDWNRACISIVAFKKDEDGKVVVDQEASRAIRQVYITEALRRLWSKYEVEPPARTLRTDAA